MTNEETLSALILMRDNCVNKREYDDPMREIKQRALEAAIKALENQERMQRELKSLDKIAETCDKLKKALELACDNQAYDLDGIEDETCGHCQYCCDGCCHHEDMVDNPEEERPCLERVVEYYKRRAGIDS